MIIPMFKYGFLVYHREYDSFLNDLQQLGVLHIIEKEHSGSEEIIRKTGILNRIEKTVQFLEKRESTPSDQLVAVDVVAVVEEIAQKQEMLESLSQELVAAKKELQKVIPWGNYSSEMIRKLKAEDLHLRFFITGKKKFTSEFQQKYQAELISETQNQVYFVVIQQGIEELNIAANEVIPPEKSLSELNNQIQTIGNEIVRINTELDHIAISSLSFLKNEKETIQTLMEFDQVILQTHKDLDDKLMVLEGWVPLTKKEQIDQYLSAGKVLFVAAKATPKDNAPILLQNNRFSKLFEPIGKIFSMPAYFELDLTVFFAPFFMLFFGFCLGDAGYGFLFIIAAGLYKLKASKAIKPYLTLIQYLGLATVLFGLLSGTLFGINLIEADIDLTANFRSLFLDPSNMFYLAILLGAVQIIFGLFLKAVNQIRQFGFQYGLATIGWLGIIIGSSIYMVLTNQKIIASNPIVLYSILFSGAFLILFFSDPQVGIFMRMGKGVWDIYSTVTGIFGDLLSYIRLFAIGLSSGILGYVVNDIALTILHASPYLGPIFFVVFLLIGHSLNIMISTLGSFVHPMRLTFVEFYKNAGFVGGGKEYKPFLKYNKQSV